MRFLNKIAVCNEINFEGKNEFGLYILALTSVILFITKDYNSLYSHVIYNDKFANGS